MRKTGLIHQTFLVARLNMGGGPFPVEDSDEVGKVTRVVFETSGGVPVQARMLGEN